MGGDELLDGALDVGVGGEVLVGDLYRSLEPASSVDTDGENLVDKALPELGELALLHRHDGPLPGAPATVASGAMIAATVAEMIAPTTTWSSLVRVARSQAVEPSD